MRDALQPLRAERVFPHVCHDQCGLRGAVCAKFDVNEIAEEWGSLAPINVAWAAPFRGPDDS